jgi:hypothetical protein
MSFLDSIKSRELKGLAMAAIECLAALESINRLAMESDGESSQPEGDQPDAQRQRLREFQLSVAQLFDARIKLKETLPELEA